jgi:hypothetical protein
MNKRKIPTPRGTSTDTILRFASSLMLIRGAHRPVIYTRPVIIGELASSHILASLESVNQSTDAVRASNGERN